MIEIVILKKRVREGTGKNRVRVIQLVMDYNNDKNSDFTNSKCLI